MTMLDRKRRRLRARLIGAAMPSVLTEISFITNKQELQLLKTNSYKDRIARALHAAVLRYRKSLKGAASTTLEW